MEIGKKMMEKWGWNKGQGLGKDKQGMKSCLVLKKQDGSSTQGRIEQAAPQIYSAKTTVKGTAAQLPATIDPAGTDADSHAAAALCAAAAAGASPGLLAAMGAELGVMGDPNQVDMAAPNQQMLVQEPDLKRPRLDEAVPMAMPAAVDGAANIPPGSLYDIDPRDTLAAGAAAAVQQMPSQQSPVGMEGMVEAAQAAAQMLSVQMAAMQAQASPVMAGMPLGLGQVQDPQQLGPLALVPWEQQQQAKAPEVDHNASRYTLLGDGPVPADYQPPPRRQRVRQYVRDDWRWSRGTEALWCSEEVQLAPTLVPLARKVLGEGSRYPARIADDTDCVTEVTAWGTLLVRPRGTGANMPLAKRMLFEVLHPNREDLREEILITPDEMAEAALQDKTLIGTGMENSEQVVEGVERSAHGKLKRVGLGAEQEALADADKEAKSSFTEVVLATSEDAELVKKHLEDLRIASGCTPVLNGVSLKLFGKEKHVKKGEHLVRTLVATGEWVALTEGFVLSEETKDKRRGDEGPSEQILIKVPEGLATQKIEQHLKAMERAAHADQLKLTSKAVAGKRTLMVEGTKAAHERVKLMVKELSEKGESPMLNKALGVARSAARKNAEATDPDEITAFLEATQRSMAPKATVSVLPPAGTEGVISKPPVPAFVDTAASTGLGAGPAMRHLPPPRLAAAQAAGTDLFAGLPPPEAPAAAAVTPQAAPADPSPAAFPPLPPGMPASGGSAGDLFAGLPMPAEQAPGPEMVAGAFQPAPADGQGTMAFTAAPQPQAQEEEGVTE